MGKRGGGSLHAHADAQTINPQQLSVQHLRRQAGAGKGGHTSLHAKQQAGGRLSLCAHVDTQAFSQQQLSVQQLHTSTTYRHMCRATAWGGGGAMSGALRLTMIRPRRLLCVQLQVLLPAFGLADTGGAAPQAFTEAPLSERSTSPVSTKARSTVLLGSHRVARNSS